MNFLIDPSTVLGDAFQQMSLELIAQVTAALEELLLRRWKEMQVGGECVVVTWIYDGEIHLCVATGEDHDSQWATRPHDDAIWLSAVSWELPAFH